MATLAVATLVVAMAMVAGMVALFALQFQAILSIFCLLSFVNSATAQGKF